MSKAAVTSATGVGITGVAGTGAYLMGAFDSKGQEFSGTPHTTSDAHVACVKDPFPDHSLFKSNKLDSSKEIKGQTKLETNFFVPVSQEIKPESCLLVSWDKRNYEGGEWTGLFRWVWSFIEGDKGFTVYNVVEAVDGKLNLSGGIYFVKREEREWVVHRYKEFKPKAPTIQLSDLDTGFPKVGSGIDSSRFGTNKDFWGFISGSTDLNSTCKASEQEKCKVENYKSPEVFEGMWMWENKEKEQKSVSDWSKDWEKWLVNMYKDVDTLKECLKEQFTKLQGQWVQKSLHGTQIK